MRQGKGGWEPNTRCSHEAVLTQGFCWEVLTVLVTSVERQPMFQVRQARLSWKALVV